MTILVIAAHPDDETLGCGGTIAKLAAGDKEVNILILGEGITSRRGQGSISCDQKIENLHKDAKAAAGIIGAKRIHFHSFPDNMFDSVPLLDIVKTIETYIEQYKPHTIFTHHGGDLNIDHSIAFRATMTAARPIPGNTIEHIYTYETLSSTDWAFGKINNSYEPNLFIDISQFIDLKIKAMEKYNSEIRTFPHPRSAQAIKTLAKQRGSMTGLPSCEAFSIIRTINI